MLFKPTILIVLISSVLSFGSENKQPAEWYSPPKISVMVGFIRHAAQEIDMEYFRKNVGSNFDADKLLSELKDAQVSYLIFYDKWHDGLVFHDTATTSIKTERDFMDEITKACRKHDVPLMIYFNAIIDGNPEFRHWALRDPNGKVLQLNSKWKNLDVHSTLTPFRQVIDTQLEELFANYGEIGGIWLDIFGERVQKHDPYMQKAYQEMFGESLVDASEQKIAEFRLRVMDGYLKSAKALGDKYQKDLVWTSNAAATDCLKDGNFARTIGSQLDYTLFEGHYISSNERWARLAWIQDKPLELGILLAEGWFVPMREEPGVARVSANEALCMSAMSLCQGSNIWLAITPSFSGVFGEDMAQVKYIGQWYKETEPYLTGARPYAEVGVALNLPDYGANSLVASQQLWTNYPFLEVPAEFRVFGVSDAIMRAGIPNKLLYEDMADETPDNLDLKGIKAVVLPETAAVSENYAKQLKKFVEEGGTLLAFGNSSRVNGLGEIGAGFAMGDLFGVEYQGQADFGDVIGKGSVTPSSTERAGWGIENALDDETTFWVSKEADENWVEFELPQTINLSRIELVARMGLFHLEDVDIEIRKDGSWQNIHQLRGNKKKTIFIEFVKPVSTDNVKIKILREIWNEKERRNADLEAIRIFDANGENWADKNASKVAVNVSDDKIKNLLGNDKLDVFPLVARVKVTDGTVLATCTTPEGDIPVIVHKSYGKGSVYYCAASESAVVGNPVFWKAVSGLLVEEPTIEWKNPDDFRQYKFVFTRVDSKYVLHVIDRNPDENPAAVKSVQLFLNPKNIGKIKNVQNVGLDYTFAPTMENGKIKLTIVPDPVASVCLW